MSYKGQLHCAAVPAAGGLGGADAGVCQGRYTNCEIYRVLIEKEEYE